MLKKTLTITAVALLGLAGETQANTVSYTTTIGSTTTDWSQLLALQQFNPSFGTLDSIDISLSSGMSTVLTVQNSASSASSGNAKTELQISLDTSSIGNYSLFGGNPVLDYNSPQFAYSLSAGQGVTSGTLTKNTSTDSGLLTDSSLFNYFTGIGNVDLGASTLTQTLLANTGGNTSSSQVTDAGLTATVTYNFTAAPVPEPTTMAMIGGGLASLVLVWRRRAKK